MELTAGTPESSTARFCSKHAAETPAAKGKTLLFLLAVVLLGGLLRVVPAPHWRESDCENYAAVAWRLAHDQPVVATYAGPPHKPTETMGPRAFAIRPGVTVPTSWVLRSFPANGWSINALPLVLGISEIVLAFLLAAALWGPRSGIVAAMLVATVPLAVSNSRALLPDLPAAVLAGWAVYVMLVASGRHRAPAVLGLGVLAGLLLGASWLTKETVALMLPAFAVIALLWFKADRKNIVALCAACMGGLLAVVVAESIYYQHATGDALFRFHEMARNFEQCKENFFYKDSPTYGWTESTYWQVLVTRLFYTGPVTLLACKASLGLGLLAMCSAVPLLRWSRPHALWPVAWAGLLMLSFNFSSTSLGEYRPLIPSVNYSYSLTLPCAVLLAGGICALLDRLPVNRASGIRRVFSRRGALCVAAGLYFVACVASAVYVNVAQRRGHLEMQRVAASLPASADVVTDFRTQFTLSYYRTGIPELAPNVARFEDVQAAESARYMVLRPATLKQLQRYSYEKPANAQAGPGWEEIYSGNNLQLFRRVSQP